MKKFIAIFKDGSSPFNSVFVFKTREEAEKFFEERNNLYLKGIYETTEPIEL